MMLNYCVTTTSMATPAGIIVILASAIALTMLVSLAKLLLKHSLFTEAALQKRLRTQQENTQQSAIIQNMLAETSYILSGQAGGGYHDDPNAANSRRNRRCT